MGDPSRVRVTGPLTPFAEGFAAELARQGYTRNSAADQVRLLAHLSRWLAAHGLDAAAEVAASQDLLWEGCLSRPRQPRQPRRRRCPHGGLPPGPRSGWQVSP